MKKIEDMVLSVKDISTLNRGYTIDNLHVPKAGNWVERAYARSSRSVLDCLLEEEALQHSDDPEYAQEIMAYRATYDQFIENEPEGGYQDED